MKHNRNSKTRWHESDLPRGFTPCQKTECVYNNSDIWIEDHTHPDYGTYENVCDNPYTAKGNSDSSCHKMSNVAVLEMLDMFED